MLSMVPVLFAAALASLGGDEPVRAEMTLSHAALDPGAAVEVHVDVRITKGWHVYDVQGVSPFTNTQLELELPAGLVAEGEWRRPKSLPSLEGDDRVFIGNVRFTRALRVETVPAEDARVRCALTYQACNQDRCLQPATTELTVPFPIAWEHRSLSVLYAGKEGGHREKVFGEFLARWFDRSATIRLERLSMETAADYDVVIVDWMSQYGCDGYPEREQSLFRAPTTLSPLFTKPVIAMTYVGTHVRRRGKLDWL